MKDKQIGLLTDSSSKLSKNNNAVFHFVSSEQKLMIDVHALISTLIANSQKISKENEQTIAETEKMMKSSDQLTIQKH